MNEIICFHEHSFHSGKGTAEEFARFFDYWVERRNENQQADYALITNAMLHEADRLGDYLRKARLYRLMAADASQQARYPDAIRYNEDALMLYRRSQDFPMIIACNNQLSRIYANLGDYSRALDYLDESLRLGSEINDALSNSNTLNAISVIYQRAGNADKAEEMASRSLQIAEAMASDRQQAIALVNLGNAYGLKQDWEKAIIAWEKAIQIFTAQKDEQHVASALGNVGIAYLRLGNLPKAEELLMRCLSVKEKLNDVYDIARSQHNLANVLGAQKRYEEAMALYQKALNMGDRVKARSVHVMIYKDMAEMLERKGDYQAAIGVFRQYHELEKELFSADMALKTQALNHRFEVERMEKEKEIYRLRNIDLAEANRQIEEKNKDITAGIRYAQRIQEALLPPAGAIGHGFSGSFVYYQPRDIVSGDFYWSMIISDSVFFAVADCTGHGVPGALMSVMGAAFLSEIINERGVRDPAEALNLLRLKLITALHSQSDKEEITDEQLRDGMDIVLCRLEPATRQLHFACANNPLWLLRDGSITEFAADRFPVGLHHGKLQYFRSQHTELRPGDRLFLFTDGYADQFGGPSGNPGGKKIGYKRFRELLIETGNLSPEEQKEKLGEYFRNWKGGQEQVDDLLVVGLAYS